MVMTKLLERDTSYSLVEDYGFMQLFLSPTYRYFMQDICTPYGSLIALGDSTNSRVTTTEPSGSSQNASKLFISFFLWGHFAAPVKCAIKAIEPDLYFNMQRSSLNISSSEYMPTQTGSHAIWEMLFDQPMKHTLGKQGGWGKKLVVGECCDGTTPKTTFASHFGTYLKTTIDFQGDADWRTPMNVGNNGPRRCQEKPAVDVIDLLQYKADVATNVFPPKDIENDENRWWFRAYAALGLANMLPMRQKLVKWLKDDIVFDLANLRSKTLGCDICLSNKENQKHSLIGNVRRLLWDGEDKHEIVFARKTLESNRYLYLTDRLVGTLASIGADAKGKQYISGQLKNITSMNDLAVEYTCNKDDCSELAIDVAKSLHNLAVYLNKLPKSSTTGIGPVIHSNPALVPSKPNHYADWKDLVECGNETIDDCQKEHYMAFQARAKHRPNMMYVGANDGHLYAFNTDKAKASLLDKTVFMYVPEGVIPYLSFLAQPIDFKQPQRYFVDGSPTVQDAYFRNTWHTVLAGGLRAGGQGVFALDITDPETFTKDNVLWDFTDFDDVDVGFVYARPAIVKMNNGDWVALFGNGYNSDVSDPIRTDCSGCRDPLGSGTGKLFIVPLNNKLGFSKIDTGLAGGLGGVAPIDLNNDGLVDIIYAGDLYGRMWKFDVNSDQKNKWKLANGGKPVFQAKLHQTIFARPSVSSHPDNKPGVVLYFGTGRRFAEGDDKLRDQAIYGVWDKCGMAKGCSFPTIDQGMLTPVTGEFSAEVNWEVNKGWRRTLGSNQVVLVPPVLRIGRLFIRTEPKDISIAALGDYNVMVFNAATGGPLDGLPLKVSMPTDKFQNAKDVFKGEANARKGNNKWWFLPATVPTPGEQEMVIYEKGEDGTFIVDGDTIFTLNPFHQELGGRSWQSWRRTGAGICR